jgi:hypothetical protein
MGWIPATFDHSKTTFPLTGAHLNVLCAQCHATNQYAGQLPTVCYNCHQQDFASAQSPQSHTGFPTDCTMCHTTTAACAKCHQTATDYTQYCCLSSGCHNTCAGGD